MYSAIYQNLPLAIPLALLPSVAQAAEPSMLFQSYDSGLTSFVPGGLALATTARALGGQFVARVLSRRLEMNGYDHKRFDSIRPYSRYTVPMLVATVLATAMAVKTFIGGQNFEMAGLAAFAGAGALAGEGAIYFGRLALAYRASLRKLTTDQERTTALAETESRVATRIEALQNELKRVVTVTKEADWMTRIKREVQTTRQIEAIEAEIFYLEIRIQGLREERYADVFASHRGDLTRYFEDLETRKNSTQASYATNADANATHVAVPFSLGREVAV